MRPVDRTFLIVVLSEPFNAVAATAALTAGADINHMPDLDDEAPDGDKNATPLMLAAGQGRADAVAFLLSQPGIDINRRNDEAEVNALMYACLEEPENLLPVADMLIRAGIDLAARDDQGWTIAEYERELRWRDPETGRKLTALRDGLCSEATADKAVAAALRGVVMRSDLRKFMPRGGAG